MLEDFFNSDWWLMIRIVGAAILLVGAILFAFDHFIPKDFFYHYGDQQHPYYVIVITPTPEEGAK